MKILKKSALNHEQNATGNIAIQNMILQTETMRSDKPLDGAEYAVRYIAYPDHLQHKSAIRQRTYHRGDT